jgi:hypothetical protein
MNAYLRGRTSICGSKVIVKFDSTGRSSGRSPALVSQKHHPKQAGSDRELEDTSTIK